MSEDIELFSEEDPPIDNGLRVLVVDDTKSIRNVISHLLTLSGFKVTTAVDGVDAMEYFLKDKFDFVITDLHMPKMDGYHLLSQIVSLSKINNQETKVLVSSSDCKKPTILKIMGIARNANNLIPLSFLVKPWKEIDLLTQTRNLFPESVQLLELDKQITLLNQEKKDYSDERLISGISETKDGIKIEIGCDKKLSLDSNSITEYLDNLENTIFCAPVDNYTCGLSQMDNQTPEATLTLLLLIRGLAEKHAKTVQFVDISPTIKAEIRKQGLTEIIQI